MFRVGEFARLSRASVKMLRHYDRLGLLRPAWVDPSTGYRHYAAAQLPRLNRILLLREVGFRLSEIRDLVERPPGDPAAADAYARQEAALARELAALHARQRALRALRAPAGDGPAVVVRPVPAVDVAARRVVLGPGDDVEPVFDEVEAFAVAAGARADAPPLLVVHGPGDVEVAVPLDRPVAAAPPVRVVRLPGAAHMACAVHTGGYDAIPAAVDRMRSWLRDAGYRPVDGVTRHVYLRFGAAPALDLPPAWLTNAGDYVTELQVAVTPVAAQNRVE